MTTGSIGRAEFSRLLWAGYGYTVQMLWWLRWPIVALVVTIITIMVIRH
jgi:hypothetical protein